MHGYFADCLSSRFSTIQINSIHFARCNGAETNECISFRSVDLAYTILMRGAKNVKAIHVDVDCFEDFTQHGLFSSISQVCSNIDSLILPGSSAFPYLKLFGNRLRRLNDGIRLLSLRCVHSEAFRESNKWACIGNTSERLQIYSKGSLAEELRKVQKYCHKLKSFDIHDRCRSDLAFSECLESLRVQFENITIYKRDRQHLEKVVTKCTNARFR